MAVTTTTLADPIGAKVIIDTDADSSGATIYQIQINNTANTTTSVTVKIADVNSNATTSSAITHQFSCPAGDKVSFILNTGIVLSSGLAFWCTTGVSSTDTTAPVGEVEVRFLTS